MQRDTIVAPATAAGEAALALIRISGPEVPRLVSLIFPGSTLPARQSVLAAYHDENGTVLDHLLALRFSREASFTGEDVLELTPHGNPFLVGKLLEDLQQRGCRLAEPGEFTRRAFLHGKLDLTQAEGIMQMIRARSDRALEAARRQMEGSLGKEVQALVDRLLSLLAHVEATIDFPEEDLPPDTLAGSAEKSQQLAVEMFRLAATRHQNDLIHEGIQCVLVGAPNAGKSSLLNALVGSDRVLVSPEPGTTRDYVEDRFRLGPHLLRVVDTAGIHETTSPLEQRGIDHTLEQIQSSDLILCLVDRSNPLEIPQDIVNQHFKDLPVLVVDNKCDLPPTASPSPFLPQYPHLAVSALTGEGLDILREKLRALIEEDLLAPDDSEVLVSARHARALHTAACALEEAAALLTQAEPPELVAAHFRQSLTALESIIGRIDHESMLDALFNEFCIGK